MKLTKKLLFLTMAMVMVFSACVFASNSGDFILTPDEGEVPYPPEIETNENIENCEETYIYPYNLSRELAEQDKIWEKYGYSKEEFDKFPDSLRNAMLFTPEEIGKTFEVPTRNDFARWEEKENKELKKNNDLENETVIKSTANEVRNAVGEFIQQTSYTCGPASARNAINGYLWHNYVRHGYSIPAEPWWGVVPSEETLAHQTNLNTTSDGTPFDTRWERVMNYYIPGRGNGYTLRWGSSGWENNFWNMVKTTLNLSGNYNVIGDLYGTITSANQINSEYTIGRSYAHYICIFGYDPDDSTVFIEDSHNTHSIHMFRVSYSRVAKACQARGIIW